MSSFILRHSRAKTNIFLLTCSLLFRSEWKPSWQFVLMLSYESFKARNILPWHFRYGILWRDKEEERNSKGHAISWAQSIKEAMIKDHFLWIWNMNLKINPVVTITYSLEKCVPLHSPLNNVGDRGLWSAPGHSGATRLKAQLTAHKGCPPNTYWMWCGEGMNIHFFKLLSYWDSLL